MLKAVELKNLESKDVKNRDHAASFDASWWDHGIVRTPHDEVKLAAEERLAQRISRACSLGLIEQRFYFLAADGVVQLAKTALQGSLIDIKDASSL